MVRQLSDCYVVGEIISDTVIKEEIATSRDYGKWLKENSFSLSDWISSSKAVVPPFDFSQTQVRQMMFGYTSETVDMLLYPMGVGGKEGTNDLLTLSSNRLSDGLFCGASILFN
jgi:hypothetical protein